MIEDPQLARSVLELLLQTEHRCAPALAKALGVDLGAIHAALDELEIGGYVEIAELYGDDRLQGRCVRRLTSRGRQAVREL